jgi:hypothetical protein
MGSATIPAASVGGQNYTLTILNTTRTAAQLSIHQMGLTFDVLVGSGSTIPPTHTTTVTRAGGSVGVDQVCVTAARCGHRQRDRHQPARRPTDAPDPVVALSGPPRLQILRAFNPATTLRTTAGGRRFTIHDLPGGVSASSLRKAHTAAGTNASGTADACRQPPPASPSSASRRTALGRAQGRAEVGRAQKCPGGADLPL